MRITSANRGERFFNYMAYFPPNAGDTVDYYPDVGHNTALMTSQSPGLYRLL